MAKGWVGSSGIISPAATETTKMTGPHGPTASISVCVSICTVKQSLNDCVRLRLTMVQEAHQPALEYIHRDKALS